METLILENYTMKLIITKMTIIHDSPFSLNANDFQYFTPVEFSNDIKPFSATPVNTFACLSPKQCKVLWIFIFIGTI